MEERRDERYDGKINQFDEGRLERRRRQRERSKLLRVGHSDHTKFSELVEAITKAEEEKKSASEKVILGGDQEGAKNGWISLTGFRFCSFVARF